MKKLYILILSLALIITGCNLSYEKPNDNPDLTGIDQGQLEPKVDDQDIQEDDKRIDKDDEEKEKMDLTLYFLTDTGYEIVQVREVHSVDHTDEVTMAALNQLISGEIKTPNAYRPLPEHTVVNSINIKDGKAIVDFEESVLDHAVGSNGETMSIQAIVNTLTEFDTIDIVEFWVEGSKEKADNWWGHVGLEDLELRRNLSEVYFPAIWLNSPQEGQKVNDKLRIEGTAIVFESTVGYTVKDSNGEILAEDFFTAGEGQGLRSFFDISFDIKEATNDKGSVSVYGFSGRDGSPTDDVIVGIVFEK